ncbi:MAG: efflux transporter outer membrane subunit [Verrucomicrobiales bacterium]|nr:efflux transporter outer membrane subunit [Verrucomicrobiales bacterium]
MHRRTVTFLFFAGAASLGLTGCTIVGHDYATPSGAALPDAWSQSVARDLQGSKSSGIAGWWKGFQDPTLNALIDRARESNPELQIALERVTEARAQRGIAASQGLPQVNAGGDYQRRRASESLLGPAPAQNPSNLYTAGFDAGWEIDLFGGIRRSVEAAEASIGAREEDYRDALVTLFADVALNYAEYRTLEARLAVAESNIAAQRGSVELTQRRLDAGLVPKIDVTQAQTNLALSESLLPQLRAQMTHARNRLSTLTGGFPGSLDSLLDKSRPIPLPKSGYAAGLPADLVRARPDIRRAERELAAQTALIGVAEADLYPRFTLFGDFSLQAVNSGNLLDSRSRAYAFGPAFQWQIFSSGRIRNAIKVEESRTARAYSAYEATVLRAVEEVETSMASIAHERDRLADIERAVAASRETVSLIKNNYENGLVSFQNVLDAERTKFSAEDEETVSRGQIARHYITLYKALGGGTATELVPPPAASQPESKPAQP